ncbi:MAG: ABC transporter permease [Flammeovirgaceae bacterium]|nr:ABC transporter permease [Flammeovirgaceae bacterium]
MASEKQKVKVPSLPTRLFEWYCGPAAAEDLLGDAEELFYENVKSRSTGFAKRKYWLRVLSLMFSYAVRKRKSKRQSNSDASINYGLIQNYIKIAFRSLMRQKTFSIINIICLSVGMSVGLLALAAWVDITEADDFHTKRDRIYRIITSIDDKNDKNTYASSSAPLAAQLKESASGIEQMVQFNKGFSGEATLRENSAIPLSGYYATDNFFNVFDFTLTQGNAGTALAHPFNIVLTRELSEKLFGTINPIGKIIPIKDGVILK